jgi:cation diffusion facilitator CzcD-associated flavoprotein CzcO
MGSVDTATAATFDVVIIGAGISGINAAYRIQTEFPGHSYTILEARNAIGGTWDLFRYPGIRSDSDLHTFGFPWHPWSENKAIADGPSIRAYIKDCAEKYGIDRKIRFHHKLLAGDWSSTEQTWNLSVDGNGVTQIFKARFIMICTGYYDYHEPLQTSIPGIDTFKGTKVHPQFWPEDLDYTNKKMVIIGSGATAVTLLPVLAERAAKVTMLQRSPSYVLALPSVDPSGIWIRKLFPAWVAHRLLRWKFLVLPFVFFKFCQAFPKAARNVIKKVTVKELPTSMPHDPNFNPSYNPWDQRLCVCPDGDFFKAIREHNADVVTDTIKTVTATGIQTIGGKTIDADIIVTATGLKIQLAGGAKITVNGQPFPVNDKYLWKGIMLQDLPNAAFVIGYTNASWTLGADTTAQLVCRLMKHLEKNQLSSAVPKVKDDSKMKPAPVLDLSSTYIEKAKGILPKAGDVAPWKPRSNYFTDSWVASWGSVTTDLHFTEKGKKFN